MSFKQHNFVENRFDLLSIGCERGVYPHNPDRGIDSQHFSLHFLERGGLGDSQK